MLGIPIKIEDLINEEDHIIKVINCEICEFVKSEKFCPRCKKQVFYEKHIRETTEFGKEVGIRIAGEKLNNEIIRQLGFEKTELKELRFRCFSKFLSNEPNHIYMGIVLIESKNLLSDEEKEVKMVIDVPFQKLRTMLNLLPEKFRNRPIGIFMIPYVSTS